MTTRTALTVLVCGGHVNVDPRKVQAWLNANLAGAIAMAASIKPSEVNVIRIVEGNADGADEGAGMFAIEHNIEHLQFAADWATYGTKAGPKRNRDMFFATQPDVVVAFPGKAGTRNMVELVKDIIAKGGRCYLIEVKGDFGYGGTPVKNTRHQRGK